MGREVYMLLKCNYARFPNIYGALGLLDSTESRILVVLSDDTNQPTQLAKLPAKEI